MLAVKQMAHGVWFRKHMRIWWFSLILLWGMISGVAPLGAAPLAMDVYESTSCPHCRAAHEWLVTYQRQHPEIEVHEYQIDRHTDHLKKFKAQLVQLKEPLDFTVPAFFVCGAHWAGFSTATAPTLVEAIAQCQQKIARGESLDSFSQNLQQRMRQLPYLHLIQLLQMPSLLVPILAMLDAVSTHSFFFICTWMAWILLQPTQQLRVWVGATGLVGLLGVHLLSLVAPETLTPVVTLSWMTRVLGSLVLLWSVLQWRGHEMGMIWRVGLSLGSAIGLAVYLQTSEPNMILLMHPWHLMHPAISTAWFDVILLGYGLVYLSVPILCFMILLRYADRLQIKGRLMSLGYLFFVAGVMMIYPAGLNAFFWSFLGVMMSVWFAWWIAPRLQNRISSDE